jgi:hypothetical protein
VFCRLIQERDASQEIACGHSPASNMANRLFLQYMHRLLTYHSLFDDEM